MTQNSTDLSFKFLVWGNTTLKVKDLRTQYISVILTAAKKWMSTKRSQLAPAAHKYISHPWLCWLYHVYVLHVFNWYSYKCYCLKTQGKPAKNTTDAAPVLEISRLMKPRRRGWYYSNWLAFSLVRLAKSRFHTA